MVGKHIMQEDIYGHPILDTYGHQTNLMIMRTLQDSGKAYHLEMVGNAWLEIPCQHE